MTSVLIVTGVALSLGRFPSATARLTYDRRKAESGGYVYAVVRGEQVDDEAIRVSEAVLVTSGGPGSHAAVVAREHGVPALMLPGASWKAGALELEAPVLGLERKLGGTSVRPVASVEEKPLPEGCVVSVDSERGALRVVPDDEQDDALALADAVRGYEGLRDARALLNWYDGRGRKALAARLYGEVSSMIAAGKGKPADAKALVQGLGPDALAGAAARREAARWPAAAADLKASISAAGTPEAVDRLASEAQARAAGVAAVCAAGGVRPPAPDGASLAELARARRAALEKAGPRTLAQAAEAAGARTQPSRTVEPALYERFVAESGLESPLSDIAQDASLRLAQKSDRIRALFKAAKAPAELAAALEKLCFPDGLNRVSGEDETVENVPCGAFVDAVKTAWASSWDPGPLGARKRAGKANPSPFVEVSREPGAVGTLYSRDPATGRRRAVVSWGGAEYALGLDGRLLAPPAAAPETRLSTERVRALSRLARELDAYFGDGAQASFTFSPDGKPVLLDAKSISASR